MSPNRVVLLVLLVVLAGCTGISPDGTEPADVPTSTTEQPVDDPTTDDDMTTSQPTEPHTGVGTSHAPDHFSVRSSAQVSNVTVTLAPNGSTETYHLDAGRQLDLTREIHERGHDVRLVVVRGNETVFDHTVYGYESYDLVVDQNDTRVTLAQV